MKIRVDWTVLALSLVFIIPGLYLIWLSAGLGMVLGVALVVIGVYVERT